MPEKDSEAPPAAPLGTSPRRPAWPLVLLLLTFMVWFAFLIWMAMYYPAR